MREFWELTPAETMGVLRAWNWREGQTRKRLVWQAWHIAALTRAKRMPSMSVLLGEEAEPLTPELQEERKLDHEAMVAQYEKHRAAIAAAEEGD